jgi:hypothetical protein
MDCNCSSYYLGNTLEDSNSKNQELFRGQRVSAHCEEQETLTRSLACNRKPLSIQTVIYECEVVSVWLRENAGGGVLQ